MTGATSRIGAEAIKHLAEESNRLIIVGARGSNRIAPQRTEALPLDLSSMESVRTFAEKVKQRLGKTPINLLILNAGTQFSDNAQKSEDGFELTFATNHLSHYLLARLLWSNMAKGGKIIFTTSDTHDPEIVFFAPKDMVPQKLAYPKEKPAMSGIKAYASSKLCNILTARYFNELRIKEQRNITVIAYNPGPTSNTGLGSKHAAFMKFMVSTIILPIIRVMSIFKPAFRFGTPERAGEALAQLAEGTVTLPKDRIYASLVTGKITFPDPSQLAQNNDVRDLLWKESAKMLGLPVN